jgi:hypothetical protein
MSAPPKTRKLTPDEMLAEFRLFCREHALVPTRDVDRRINHDTTVRELNELTSGEDLIPWTAIVVSLDIEVPDEWGTEWAPDHLLSDICVDLSERVLVPVVEPITLLGRKCDTAGAFLTLKRMLADSGADVSELAPSSPLAPMCRKHSSVIHRFRLAYPGRLGWLKVTNTPACFGCLFVVVGILMLIGGASFPERWTGVICPIGLVMLMISGVLFLISRVFRSRLEFVMAHGYGSLHTFRDYIYALHGRHRRAAGAR